MTNYAAVARIVSSNRNVKAVAPFVMGPVLLETRARCGAVEGRRAVYSRASTPRLRRT